MNRVMLIALLVACGSEKKSGSGGGGDDGDKKGGCRTPAKTSAELVTGKAPQLLPPFAGLKLGMSPDDAKKACPNLFEDRDAQKTGTFSVGEIVGEMGETMVHGRLQFEKDKLVAVEYKLPDDSVAALTKAWGAPKAATGGKPAQAWHDEATGMRAVLAVDALGGRELGISAYMPLEAFIEQEPTRIAWKPQDVLGKTPAELEKLFPQYVGADTTSAEVKAKTKEMMADLDKEVKAMGIDTSKNKTDLEVRLPATPLASDWTTHVILHLADDGTVRSYGLWFRTEELGDYGFPSEPADVVKLLDKVWGPHKLVKDVLGNNAVWYDAKRGVRAEAQIDPAKPNAIDVSFVRYTPLANLFGAAGAVWGFEKPERPLLGATVEELTAAYGKAVEIKPDTAVLRLPPSDYQGDTGVTTLLMFLDKGKVRQWNMDLPYDDYEPARAEYEALLDAKFGKPTAAPRDHFIYGTKPKVDVQYSKYTHSLNMEVTPK